MRAGPETLAATLFEQGMPMEEIRSLLEAEDPTTVRHHLALHRERLAERLDDQLRAVDRLERCLFEDGTDPRRALIRTG
jgi:DNA-binding transcriptional MerR regulator